MTPDQLKQKLVALLTDPKNLDGGNILGTYTLPGGTVLPAITDQRVPDDWKVYGVEVVLPIVETGYTQWYPRHVGVDQRWELELVQWPPAEGGAQYLRQVVDRLRRFLEQSYAVAVPADDLLGTLPQARLSFPFWALRENLRPLLFNP